MRTPEPSGDVDTRATTAQARVPPGQGADLGRPCACELRNPGFTTSIVSRLEGFDGWRHRVEWLGWSAAIALDLIGVLLAAAVIAVRAKFESTDTSQVTRMERPLLGALADDYAGAVRLGEETVADRVNAFQVATRYTVWGAIITAAVFVMTAA